MSTLTHLHTLASHALFACALTTVLTRTRAGRITALTCGPLAALSLTLGVYLYPAFELGRRRAVYFTSHAAGLWLDRKTHFGLAACCFGLALASLALDPRAPRGPLRVLAGLCALFVLLALLALGLSHMALTRAH